VTVAVAALLAALLSAGLGATVAIVAHGVDDPPAAHDAWLSAYAGALGGAAYAALFSFGASFGKRGGGRAVLLVLDWALGSNRSAASLLTPRGHLRNLLGGEAPFGLSERASAAALLAILVMCTLLSVRRVRQT